MALLSPGAPELGASAASVRMTVPDVSPATRTASSRGVISACSFSRASQKPLARPRASLSAISRSLSVTTRLLDPRLDTSVNGLPITMAAASPRGRSSIS